VSKVRTKVPGKLAQAGVTDDESSNDISQVLPRCMQTRLSMTLSDTAHGQATHAHTLHSVRFCLYGHITQHNPFPPPTFSHSTATLFTATQTHSTGNSHHPHTSITLATIDSFIHSRGLGGTWPARRGTGAGRSCGRSRGAWRGGCRARCP